MSERISRNLRFDFYENVINKDIAFFDERRTGDLRKFMKSFHIISFTYQLWYPGNLGLFEYERLNVCSRNCFHLSHTCNTVLDFPCISWFDIWCYHTNTCFCSYLWLKNTQVLKRHSRRKGSDVKCGRWKLWKCADSQSIQQRNRRNAKTLVT